MPYLIIQYCMLDRFVGTQIESRSRSDTVMFVILFGLSVVINILLITTLVWMSVKRSAKKRFTPTKPNIGTCDVYKRCLITSINKTKLYRNESK